MFKRDSLPMASAASGETIIAQGVRVEGDFVSQGDVMIDGEVSGSVQTASSLRVGETAKIHADVTARSAVIAGVIEGNLHVAERLELLETSRIQGDVEAQILSVAPGATINGRVSMGVGASGERE